MPQDTGWFKSSYSGAANDTCVEVRLTGHGAGLRDSKNPDGGAFWVASAAWASFLGLVSEPCAGGR